jgi:hypothetical protein
MIVPEDKLPDSIKKNAYHPSSFIYAWKKSYLEKLFDELLLNNFAISAFEAWLIEDEVVSETIPLQNGQIQVFSYKYSQEKEEQWYDFVERTVKKTTETINNLNLEKNVRLDLTSKIWYHFELVESSSVPGSF